MPISTFKAKISNRLVKFGMTLQWNLKLSTKKLVCLFFMIKSWHWDPLVYCFLNFLCATWAKYFLKIADEIPLSSKPQLIFRASNFLFGTHFSLEISFFKKVAWAGRSLPPQPLRLWKEKNHKVHKFNVFVANRSIVLKRNEVEHRVQLVHRVHRVEFLT